MTATKRSRSRTAPRKRTSAKRSPAKRGSSRRRVRRDPALTRLGRALVNATEGHRADLTGLVCIGLGLLAGLGIYAHQAGPVGHGLARASGALVGLARALVPPGLIVIGALLIRGWRAGEPDPAPAPSKASRKGTEAATGEEVAAGGAHDAAPSPHTGARRILGVAVALVGAMGLLHLARGGPHLGASVDDLSRAGGWVGAGIADPLRSVAAMWGAVLVLVLLGVLGVVLITGVTLRTATEGATRRAADGVRPARRAAGKRFGALFRVGAKTDADAEAAAASGESDPDGLRFGGAAAEAGASTDEPVPAGAETPFDQETAKAPKRRKGAAAEAATGPAQQLEMGLGPAAKRSAWKIPPVKLLERSGAQQVNRKSIEETGRTLENALAEHGVETRLVGMTVGPTVTRYELELGPGVKVSRLTSLHKDIAYAMATPDVRILAPIPGRQAIGVEVPNVRKQLVTVGDILTSPEAAQAKHPLEVAVGRDIAGKPVLADLASMPHVLIAGATGAGKSSCINSIMTSLLMRTTPDQVRMILVDPKRVELGQYNGLPHLLTEVVTNPKKAANALAWAVREMERRYDLLAEVGVRDVGGYNAAYDRGDLTEPGADGSPPPDFGKGRTYERLPYIVVVVDELNDLMMVAARDVEESITRIAQMARAVGIHLVIATQRPSVNVITGVIKANIPARWAFAVSSLQDSRVILDQPGAEKLLGKGDMLLLGPASSVPRRIQGSWVNEDEVRAAVAYWKRQAPEVAYDDEVQGTDDGPASRASFAGGTGDDDDELLVQATELVVRSQLGSTSMLQRKLRVGFARAGRLMDLLEQRGIVGPSEGSKARSVLMRPEELDGVAAGGEPPADAPGGEPDF
ncbi:MAG: DNA translocase FtsK [Acidimicrobiales bacterium]